jgi:hypothetical protein
MVLSKISGPDPTGREVIILTSRDGKVIVCAVQIVDKTNAKMTNNIFFKKNPLYDIVVYIVKGDGVNNF